MAYTDARRAITGGYLSRAISNFVADIAAWNEARATRLALSRLTDHELDDIGLRRADLGHLSTGHLISR